MKYQQLSVFAITYFLSLAGVLAQTGGAIFTKNVAVIGRDNFNKGLGGDVWGIKIAGNPDKHYALVTIGGGLSIVQVNATSPSYYEEVSYVNHDDYYNPDPQLRKNLGVADVETFVVNQGGIDVVYAALAVPDVVPFVVYIINVTQAIADGPLNQNRFVPISTVLKFTIPWYNTSSEAHTITIMNNILYVATQTQNIDIWDVSNPSNPIHKGAYPLPDPVPGTNRPGPSVHEMYVDPNGPRAYVAYTRGGLYIVDINLSDPSSSTIFKSQMYDSDKRYANSILSQDRPDFDWRLCHSAWPTDDRSYIFTTDEISPGYSGYPDGDYIEAPNLKVWKTAELGTSTALKGNYFVRNGQENASINQSLYPTTDVPNSIHQLHTRDGYAYIAHYTEGFRVVSIANPENLVELGYFDSFAPLDANNYTNYGGGVLA